MSRLYLVLAAIGVVCCWRSWKAPVWWRRFSCWLRDRHDPVRHHLGGQVCRNCTKAARDRDGLGEDATVHGMRAYSRENGGTFYRSARWFP